MTHIEKITAARAKLKAAQDELTKSVADAFPKGCSISVWLGRANIVATVEAHSTGKDAGCLCVKNQRTGKTRRFHVLYNEPTRLGV